MAVAKDLVSVLACAKCTGPVRLSADGQWVVCSRCLLQYPVRDDVPVMIPDEAVSSQQAPEPTSQGASQQTVILQVVEGKNKGQKIHLPVGSCCAIGRSVDDVEKTQVFEAGGTVGLDESTKQLVLSYITQQFKGKSPAPTPAPSEASGELGSFKRLPDLALSDGAISRLHAMLFHAINGVGILDLVSKNGTFVNGIEVESKFLKADDVVTLGGTKLRLCQESS